MPSRLGGQTVQCPNCETPLVLPTDASSPETTVADPAPANADWQPAAAPAIQATAVHSEPAAESFPGFGQSNLGHYESTHEKFAGKATNVQPVAAPAELGTLLFKLERKSDRNPGRRIYEREGGLVLTSLSWSLALLIIFAMLGLGPLGLILALPAGFGVTWLLIQVINRGHQTCFVNVYEHGLHIFHPIGVLNFFRKPTSVRFSDITKIATQDQSGFYEFKIRLLRSLRYREWAADMTEKGTSRNLVIHQQAGPKITLYYYRYIYARESLGFLLKHVKTRHPHIDVSLTIIPGW